MASGGESKEEEWKGENGEAAGSEDTAFSSRPLVDDLQAAPSTALEAFDDEEEFYTGGEKGREAERDGRRRLLLLAAVACLVAAVVGGILVASLSALIPPLVHCLHKECVDLGDVDEFSSIESSRVEALCEYEGEVSGCSPGPCLTPDETLSHSSEYQFSLFTRQWQGAEERDTMADLMVAAMDGSPFAVDEDRWRVGVRQQYYVHMDTKDHCHSSLVLRVREYISGPDAGKRYLDMKDSSSSREKACSSPLSPNPAPPFGVLGSYHQKCEHDVHPCDDKYAREARVFVSEDFQGIPQLTRCSDVQQLWPWAMGDLQAELVGNPLRYGGDSYWWVREYEALADEESVFQLTFTLEYDTIEEAESGDAQPKSSSEFSFRIVHGVDGRDEELSPELAAEADALYRAMLEEFGSKDEYENGVCIDD